MSRWHHEDVPALASMTEKAKGEAAIFQVSSEQRSER